MFRILLTTIFLALADLLAAQAGRGRPQPLEPTGGYYATLAQLSSASNPLLAGRDTLRFPLQAYSNTSLWTEILRPIYLDARAEAALAALLQPPANSSDQTQAELNFLLELQQQRSPTEIAQAKYLASIGFSVFILNPTDSAYATNEAKLFFLARGAVGEWFTPTEFPAIAQLLRNAMRDIRITEYRLKRIFRRPRPVQLEPRLQPLEVVGSPAFPSGHTLFSFTQAYLFSEIIPEKRTAFLQQAEAARRSREILGIHYPSDNEASRVLGWHLLQWWWKNPAFRRDLAAAQAEWQAKKRG